LRDEVFRDDLRLLLPAGVEYDPQVAAAVVREELIVTIPGKPWKGLEA
jgi:hypothetical protein